MLVSQSYCYDMSAYFLNLEGLLTAPLEAEISAIVASQALLGFSSECSCPLRIFFHLPVTLLVGNIDAYIDIGNLSVANNVIRYRCADKDIFPVGIEWALRFAKHPAHLRNQRRAFENCVNVISNLLIQLHMILRLLKASTVS